MIHKAIWYKVFLISFLFLTPWSAARAEGIPGSQWATARYPEGPEGVCEPMARDADCGIPLAIDVAMNGPVLWKPQALRCEPAEPVPAEYWGTTITFIYAQSFVIRFPYRDPVTHKCFVCTSERGKKVTWYKGVQREIRQAWLGETDVVDGQKRVYGFYDYSANGVRRGAWAAKKRAFSFITYNTDQHIETNVGDNTTYNAEWKSSSATTMPLRCIADPRVSNLMLGDPLLLGRSLPRGAGPFRIFPEGVENPGMPIFRQR